MKQSMITCFFICWIVLTAIAVISVITFETINSKVVSAHHGFLIPLVVWVFLGIAFGLTGTIQWCARPENATNMDQEQQNEDIEMDTIVHERTTEEQHI